MNYFYKDTFTEGSLLDFSTHQSCFSITEILVFINISSSSCIFSVLIIVLFEDLVIFDI